MPPLRTLIAYLIPVVALELVLMIAALRDLSRRDLVNGPKWVWALIIIFLQLVGPILYFAVGRRDD